MTDLERSRRFYEEVLGFRYWWELDVPTRRPVRLMQLPARRSAPGPSTWPSDRFVLELIHFADAGVHLRATRG